MKSLGNYKYLLEDGTIRIYKPKHRHRITLRLPEDLYQKLDEKHWQERKSINALIVEILTKKVK